MNGKVFLELLEPPTQLCRFCGRAPETYEHVASHRREQMAQRARARRRLVAAGRRAEQLARSGCVPFEVGSYPWAV